MIRKVVYYNISKVVYSYIPYYNKNYIETLRSSINSYGDKIFYIANSVKYLIAYTHRSKCLASMGTAVSQAMSLVLGFNLQSLRLNMLTGVCFAHRSVQVLNNDIEMIITSKVFSSHSNSLSERSEAYQMRRHLKI